MIKNVIIVVLLFVLQVFHAQIKVSVEEGKKIMNALNYEKDYSQKLYDLGNAAFAKKEYDKADSLFTTSLKILPHPDTYYNRAVCRRRMNDFSGYCVDLASAANMRDKESYNLYCKECAKVDTIFTKGTNEPATKKDFDFATFTTSYKYNTNVEYEQYDKRGNLLLSYIVMGSDTIYLKSNEVISAVYKEGDKAIEEFIKTRTNFYTHITQEKIQGSVTLALTIGASGKVRRVKVLVGLRDGSADSLARALYKLDAYEPATYKGKNVKYQSQISVNFGINSLSVYEKRPKYKLFDVLHSLPDSVKDVFTVVEAMPEFPGGPTEMMKFVQNNIKIPTIVKTGSVSGKSFVKFVIGADGLIYNVEILKGVPGCLDCDMEAIRVVSLMPKWKPGTQNGITVPVFFNLPINFQLR